MNRIQMSLLLCFVALGAVTLAPVVAHAQEAEKTRNDKKKNRKKGKKKTEAPVPDDPALAAMLKAGAPGKEHKALRALAGQWDVATRAWMAPGAPPAESNGTATHRVVLGGRFLQQSFRGEFLGMKFQGIGFVGYDNAKKTYVTSWMDTMNTTIMGETGTYDDSTKIFTFRGEYSDPATGKTRKTRSTLRVEGKERIVTEMFEVAGDGSEAKTVELVYTRKVKAPRREKKKPKKKVSSGDTGAAK